MLHTRDTDKDSELIELLIARAHETIRTHALSKDPDEGGHLPIEHTYEGPDGKRYNIREVASTWPKTLRSHVMFSCEDDDDQVFALPIAKWVSAGFKAVFDQFDVHQFRDDVAEMFHDETHGHESLHQFVIGLHRDIGVYSGNERHAPIEVAPFLIDKVSTLLGGERDALLTIATECVCSAQPEPQT